MTDCVYLQQALLSHNKFTSLPLAQLYCSRAHSLLLQRNPGLSRRHHGSLRLLDFRGNSISSGSA
jgi:hypothetical protein